MKFIIYLSRLGIFQYDEDFVNEDCDSLYQFRMNIWADEVCPFTRCTLATCNAKSLRDSIR